MAAARGVVVPALVVVVLTGAFLQRRRRGRCDLRDAIRSAR